LIGLPSRFAIDFLDVMLQLGTLDRVNYQ
jgi:hypothetical protein